LLAMSEGVLSGSQDCSADLLFMPFSLRLRRQYELLALLHDQALRHFVQLLLLARQLRVVGGDSSLHLLQQGPRAARHVPHQWQLLVQQRLCGNH
jgi:hypothetical protein